MVFSPSTIANGFLKKEICLFSSVKSKANVKYCHDSSERTSLFKQNENHKCVLYIYHFLHSCCLLLFQSIEEWFKKTNLSPRMNVEGAVVGQFVIFGNRKIFKETLKISSSSE